MEDVFASFCSGILVLGYGALAYGVGSFASNRGLNFGTFFVLALLFNPLFMFLVAAFLGAGSDSNETDASSATTRASSGADTQAVEQQRHVDGTADHQDQASSQTSSGTSAEHVADGPGTTDESASSEESFSPDEPAPSYDPSSSEESGNEDDSLADTYERETRDRQQEGKVRCDTCYSVVDESASECPACGSSMDSGSGFF